MSKKKPSVSQNDVNKSIHECIEGLADALDLASASRDILMKLLKFEGNRIDTLENKVDLLIMDKANEIEAEAEKRMDIIGQNGNDGEHYNLDGSV